MDAALELEAAVSPAAFHRADRLLHPADPGGVSGDHLHPPTLSFDVSHVHTEQLGREQAGLFAARAGPDLQDDVPVGGGILGDEHELEGRLQCHPPLVELRQLRGDQLAHLRLDRLLQQAARPFQLPEELLEAVIFLHHRIQLGVQLGCPLILRRIRQHDRVGEPRHDLAVPALDGIQLVVQCGHGNLVKR
jgi:hypothetical protein